jgi:cobalt-zinc-cadmium efflux system outer membrane protein
MKPWLSFSSVVLTLALSANHAVAANESSYLPPQDLIRLALDQHPDVLRAGAMVQSANAIATARRVGPHELMLNGEYVSRDTRMEGQFSEWSGGISRGFRLPGKANADRQIGDFGIDVADNGYEDARHQAALSLKNLWLGWLAAESEYAIASSEVQTHEMQFAATERRVELGDAAILETDQVRAALAQMRIQEALADQLRQEAKVSLQRNFPSLTLPAMAPELPDPSLPPSDGNWEAWRMAVVSNSHEIKMAQSEAERRQWLARRARLDRFADPTLGLRAFQERGGAESGVGVFLSIPVGGRLRNAESDALAAEAVAAELDARMVTRDVELVAEHDILKVQMGMEAWRQSSAALEASAQAVARMQRSFDVGESGLTELLVARRQDFEVRRAETNARVAAHDAVLQLQIDSHRIWGLGDDE